MNDLDKQLAELALINRKELTPSLQSNSGTLGRKVGPAVPPKPKKPQPQVPQSYPLKHSSEPLYSSGLSTNSALYSNASSNAHTYANSGRMSSTSSNQSIPQQRYQNTYANLPRDDQRYLNQYNAGPSPSLSSMAGSTMGQRGYDPRSDQVTYSNIQVGNRVKPESLVYSNLMHPQRGGSMYSNLNMGSPAPPYGNGGADDLPPPPPPLTSNLGDYQPCTVNTNLPPPPEDLVAPPSPVSSSYSELRRATGRGQDYSTYGMGSQYADSDFGYGNSSKASSTYESIYEPINPRPPSQLSSRSNYSLYAPYVSGNNSVMTGPSQSASRMGLNKDQEVDSLTDLLVQGLDNDDSDILDTYGHCTKCKEKIVGASNGCTAMSRLYHTKCFTCHQCAVNLQGKPFYALNGKPYCEEDYFNTLEKCCVCQKPIMDRILRATGKPYHPGCFCCVVCGKSLDGIPFTVDATNRVHCIEDFHKIFAPRCWVCKQPIMPEPGEEETVRVVALDHSFHVQCYKCEDCGLVLSSEAEGRGCYPLDGHVLCKSCNAKRVQAISNNITTEL
ncbi:thyroid receptor-interacting protein 6 isoform X1 [Coccinella septempunctata]|uniref:thyroid receptor-interacting protein 6 isoform X1 n=1 Tax=Coccinella septempunctata TaxID=41139 RepID=UPI001D077F59|nr:thyroid receptor-interacting protein 6 isoform X1 [Coccinella septempunctata]XP_044764265.1 thyroid receptor-interacting protein 6 isoform X1 [Coccinella septempunctata]